MEDLLSCMVCCEPYQEKMRHPVLLPRCGHSFCRPCIAFMVKGGTVVCPSCRLDQRVDTADDLPTEFSLLAITAAQQMAKMETCQTHDAKLSFWCKTCKIATCGECLFEDHPTHSHEVIKATRYIIEMKDAINDLANKFMETLDVRERRLYEQIYKSAKGINDALRTICVLRKDMEEARDLMKGVKKVDGIAPTSRLSEAAKFLALKWNLHDAKLGLSSQKKKAKQQEQEQAKKEIEAQTEKEEEKGKEEEEEKDKEDKEDKEKGDDDKAKEGKEGEKENGEDDEESEEDDEEEEEEEVLTEEEIRKRNKILRVKERIAAAAAAAAAAKEEKEKKLMEKERKSIKDKKNAPAEPPPVIPSPSILKPWKKVIPAVSREPSITPEREVEKKEDAEKKDASPDKEDKESKENKENLKDKESKDEKEEGEKQNKEEDKENKDKDSNNKAAEPTQEQNNDKDKDTKASEKEPSPNKDNKENNEENNKENNKETQKTETNSTSKTAEAPKGAESAAKDAKEEPKEAKKSSVAVANKRPRGRLARQALKRAQTMDLAKAKAECEKAEAEAQSQNIQGLDLETGKSNKAEETERRDSESGASGGAKEESKEQEEKKEEKEGAKEEKKEEEKKEGAAAAVQEEEEEEEMFELDPDEKDRIATELMMVPSLTVCVEGRGGLMARVQWEPQGLHVYAHQSQELPYDVLIKSSVLNALIPTKSPTVFLDIEYEQRPLGRVYITLWGHLRRANNFLLLCTGEGGACLRSSKFFEVCNPEAPGERLKGGDYEFNNGRGGEAIVEELEFGGDYAQPMEAGMITAGGSGHRCFDSQFFICTEGDPNRNFACPFGVVTSGLNYLKEAVWLVVTKEIWIEECGVVLDVPRF